MLDIKDDEIAILIQWELKELRERLKSLRQELDTLMIHRNTAALREIALSKAGVPYPGNTESVGSLDRKVEEKVAEIKSVRGQLSAWEALLNEVNNPVIRSQITPNIRTIEL